MLFFLGASLYLVLGFLWRGKIYLADHVIQDRRYYELPVKWPDKWTKKLVVIYILYSLGWLLLDFFELFVGFVLFLTKLPKAIEAFRKAL